MKRIIVFAAALFMLGEVLMDLLQPNLMRRIVDEGVLGIGENADALGLMFVDRDRSALTPLVYVPAAGTLFWETSCASGTTAVGAWAAGQNCSPGASGLPLTLSLKQPGGTLEITAEQDGTLSLTGLS